jgi:hypothetical protein
VPLPLTPEEAAPLPISQTVPPAASMVVADPHLQLPKTYQWNIAIERALGDNQTFSVTYVGAAGRNLLRETTLQNPNPDFLTVAVTGNTATSDYNALQLKFQRQLAHRLQALISYTWAHSIDISSSDTNASTTPLSVGPPSIDRGDSDFDIRHSFNGAVSYDVPPPSKSRIARALLGNWSLDTLLTVRSALPVTLTAATFIVNGNSYSARPNVVANQPFYLYGSQYPGGKAFNKAAFTTPAAGQQGNLGRNSLRGFGAWQDDFTVRRRFQITEKIGLQFRADFFNIFNHPNFASPENNLSSPLFGQSTQTLGQSLGSGGQNGGFNPLYQVGGPRSIQLALKLQF